MQHGIGRAVGVVRHVISGGIRELVFWMEAGDLINALEIHLLQQGIGQIKKLIVISKVMQHFRMDQQSGFNGAILIKLEQFAVQVIK